MKLSLCEIAFEQKDEMRVLQLLQQYGFSGLEIAPTLFIGQNPYGKCAQAAEKARRLREEYGLSIPSMQSIWYGQQGNLFDENDAPHLAAYTCRAAGFAEAIGCRSMVFGCPRQRNIPAGKTAEDAVRFFASVSAAAQLHHTCVALEANVGAYGTNFCTNSAETFAFAKNIPGLRVNYDLGTLLANGESLDTLFENLPMVSHIHISEPALAPIEKRGLHRELAEGLAQAGYDGFVSVEMKTQPVETVQRVLACIAEVFS